MTTKEIAPSHTGCDLTPDSATLEGKRDLIVLSKDATPRDVIALADFLALQTVEIVDTWPTEGPMPMVLVENVRQLQRLLCHLENITRDQVEFV